MNSIRQTLHDYWFSPAPATRLALLRILIGTFILWFLLDAHDDYIGVARTSHQLFAPVGVVFHGPISPTLFEWLLDGTIVAALCFTLGVCHRVTGPVFSALLLWLLCYRNSWSMIYHSDNLVVLHVIVLGFTRSADAWSFDALFRDRGDRAIAAGNLAGWQYNWPVQLICALTVTAYFVTGVAKLASELGVGWITGQNLRAQMAVDSIRKELLGAAPNQVAYALYDWLPLFAVLAIGTMVVELFAPLALLNRRLGWLWAITAFGFHWGILVVMNITFHYQLAGVMFASFFPLERVVEWPRKLWPRRARGAQPSPKPEPAAGLAVQPNVSHATLYYDGDCGLCDRFVQFVLRHDRREYFQFATLQSEAGRELLSRLELPQGDLKTVVLVEADGSFLRSSATLRVCRRLGGLWPLLYAFMVIPKPWRDGVYSFVARNRKRWFKPPGECPVMPPEWRRRFVG